MFTLEFHEDERPIIRDALELYLHTIKGEPQELKKPASEREQHFDEDMVRDLIMRFE